MNRPLSDNLRRSANLLFILVLLSLFFNRAALASISDSDILVNIDWLLEHQAADDIVIVDVRPEEAYRSGHIPGAINLPADSTIRREPPKDLIGDLNQIKSLLGNAGISHDDHLVIYDDGMHKNAGHAFWVFEVYNHKSVKLLNGGFPAWQKNGDLPVEVKTVLRKPTNYIPSIEPQRHINQFGMRLAIENTDRVIIDVRSPDEFRGLRSTADRRGHIPGAINIPATDNFIEEGGIKMLKPLDELSTMYAHIDTDKKIYTYCNRGKESSLTYTILRQLGHDVAQYDGSWMDWGNDPTTPINTPVELEAE